MNCELNILRDIYNILLLNRDDVDRFPLLFQWRFQAAPASSVKNINTADYYLIVVGTWQFLSSVIRSVYSKLLTVIVVNIFIY